jgi:hypothetical protein
MSLVISDLIENRGVKEFHPILPWNTVSECYSEGAYFITTRRVKNLGIDHKTSSYSPMVIWLLSASIL